MKKINPIIQWWMTPKLPYHDIFEFPLLMNRTWVGKLLHVLPHWVIHPIKRRLARWYLKILRTFTDIKVVGVTGSAGKSTTVQMMASILKHVAPTVATPHSIDPIYNVPNTILKTKPWTKFLILEMSVEYPGEMDYYLWLAKPDIGVITNIYPTHTEFLKSTQGVFEEKSKLVKNSKIAILNKRDNYLKSLVGKLKAKIIWFEGENEDAANTLATLLEIKDDLIGEGLKNYSRPEHRAVIIKHKSGATIYDDSYNSNPEAFLFTLRKFNKLAGKNTKAAVVGDMLELGKLAIMEHKRVGREIKKSNFSIVFGVGKLVKYITADVFDSWEKVLPHLKKYLKPKTYILIKGSRSIGLDRLVLKLTS